MNLHRLKRGLTLVGEQHHTDPDRMLIENLMDEKVHYTREKLASLVLRFAFGISLSQIFADGLRPSDNLESIKTELGHLLNAGIVQGIEFIVYNHRRNWSGGMKNHSEKHIICPCQPIAEMAIIYFHEKNLRHIETAKAFHQKATWI